MVQIIKEIIKQVAINNKYFYYIIFKNIFILIKKLYFEIKLFFFYNLNINFII